jgi:hypothetical protein
MITQSLTQRQCKRPLNGLYLLRYTSTLMLIWLLLPHAAMRAGASRHHAGNEKRPRNSDGASTSDALHLMQAERRAALAGLLARASTVLRLSDRTGVRRALSLAI